MKITITINIVKVTSGVEEERCGCPKCDTRPVRYRAHGRTIQRLVPRYCKWDKKPRQT